MLIERKLVLVRPLLSKKIADGDSEDVVRHVFVKELSQDGGYLIRSYIERWNWAFMEARDSLGLQDVSTQAITIAHRFYAPARSICSLGIKREEYECILEGEVIAQRFTLARNLPPHVRLTDKDKRCPEEEEFDAMLSYIGEYLGISECRNDLQYGTFTVKEK